jgi:hypothetical protein
MECVALSRWLEMISSHPVVGTVGCVRHGCGITCPTSEAWSNKLHIEYGGCTLEPWSPIRTITVNCQCITSRAADGTSNGPTPFRGSPRIAAAVTVTAGTTESRRLAGPVLQVMTVKSTNEPATWVVVVTECLVTLRAEPNGRVARRMEIHRQYYAVEPVRRTQARFIHSTRGIMPLSH